MVRTIPLVVLLSFLLLPSCEKKQAPPTPPVPVNVQVAKAQTVYYYDKYPATIQALSQVNIYAEVQGYITGIFFKEGDHVKKGQKLYEIDRRLYQAAYDQAQANLKVAQGNTVQAQEDADRYTYLNKEKAVAKQLYDHAVIALQNAKNSEQAAQQGVKSAQTNLTYSVIYAPFDGTIGISQVRIGNMVTVGQTVLNTISTDNPIAVDLFVNEKQLIFFENLQKSKQGMPDSLFTLVLPDNSLYGYPGKILIIDRAVNSQTGTITVRLVFPNPDNILKVGMSCVVRVHNLEATPQIVIPNKAVVEQMGEYFVFVDKDSLMAPSDSTHKEKNAEKVLTHVAVEKKIQQGQIIGPNVVVKAGIDEGERVITDGVQLLHDGARVSLGKPGADSTQKKHEH